MVGHRANLAASIYDGCKAEPNIKFHFSSAVASVESYAPIVKFAVQPRNGDKFTVETDVLLACDGIKSVIRTQMLETLGVETNVEDTGQAAYRIMLDRNKVLDDPEILKLIDSNQVTRWIGEKRHIIAYPVSSKTIYNLSTVQPDSSFTAAPDSTYTTSGSKTKMLEVFADFCPMIQRILNHVPDGEVCEWKLRVFGSIPTWINGSVALLGDAAHPTLPHLNQGAAQAMEDAAVIAVVLDKMPDTTPETINKALRVYMEVRKERAETLVQLAAASGRTLHLGEGAAREERDKQFAALKGGKGPVPDKWADADVQRMIYSHDCVRVAEEGFHNMFQNLS
jgi:salicylate hydroxylase